MRFSKQNWVRVVVALALAALFAVPQDSFAQSHVVSPAELQKQAATATGQRDRDRQQLTEFLSSDAAHRAMQSAHVDPEQVKNAVSSLNDQDLARLSARAASAQRDFAAGTLNDRDLILIILAVVALILIIIAVR